jgi:hypothetical protein
LGYFSGRFLQFGPVSAEDHDSPNYASWEIKIPAGHKLNRAKFEEKNGQGLLQCTLV